MRRHKVNNIKLEHEFSTISPVRTSFETSIHQYLGHVDLRLQLAVWLRAPFSHQFFEGLQHLLNHPVTTCTQQSGQQALLFIWNHVPAILVTSPALVSIMDNTRCYCGYPTPQTTGEAYQWSRTINRLHYTLPHPQKSTCLARLSSACSADLPKHMQHPYIT